MCLCMCGACCVPVESVCVCLFVLFWLAHEKLRILLTFPIFLSSLSFFLDISQYLLFVLCRPSSDFLPKLSEVLLEFLRMSETEEILQDLGAKEQDQRENEQIRKDVKQKGKSKEDKKSKSHQVV